MLLVVDNHLAAVQVQIVENHLAVELAPLAFEIRLERPIGYKQVVAVEPVIGIEAALVEPVPLVENHLAVELVQLAENHLTNLNLGHESRAFACR